MFVRRRCCLAGYERFFLHTFKANYFTDNNIIASVVSCLLLLAREVSLVDMRNSWDKELMTQSPFALNIAGCHGNEEQTIELQYQHFPLCRFVKNTIPPPPPRQLRRQQQQKTHIAATLLKLILVIPNLLCASVPRATVNGGVRERSGGGTLMNQTL